MKKKLILLALIGSASTTFSVFAQKPTVYSSENTGASCTAPPLPTPDNLTNYPMLPDPFAWSNGNGRSTNFNDWECRRNEIKAEIQQYEIGLKPVKPANITATYTAGVLKVMVTENGQTLTLTSNVTMPTTGTGPFPVIIGMNSGTGSVPAALFANAIKIPFNHDQVVTYTQSSTRTPSDPYFKLYPQFHPDADTYTMGNYSAWAWGVSRLIDGIELVISQINADVSHIAVTGCSYAGKMALFAGAFDERVALTIAQESGGGGAPSWRVSETIGNVEKIDNTNYSWFLPNMGTTFSGRASILPHDHHELMAMVAPRALLVTGNTDFEWLANESAYVSARATEEVYKEFGISDRFGFYIDGGHGHCAVPATQTPAMKAFIDRFLFDDKTVSTDIHEHPFPNTDYNKWIQNWKTPADPNTPAVTITSPTANKEYAEPASITITADVTDINNDVTKVQFFNGKVLLGEDTTAPYSFTWNNVAGGDYFISAEAVDATNLKGLSNIVKVKVVKQVTPVYRTFTAPTIDGTIDAGWNDPAIKTFDAKTILVGTAPYDDTDLSGWAKAMWDDTYVYLLAKVVDEVKKNDSANYYEDDGVEFYFDGNNGKTATYQTGNDVQYSFGWNDGTIVGNAPTSIPKTGISYQIVDTPDGYIFESRIPWANFGVTPAEGKKIGFDFMINDDDDANANRDGKKSWNASNDSAYQNTSVFGTIELAGKIPTGEIYKVTTPPTIDGTIDAVWNNPIIERFNARNFLVGGPFDDIDLSGYSKAIWDDTNIYLLAQVTDEAKKNDSANYYEDDGIEYYFDGNNGKSATYQTGNDVQYSFGWNDNNLVGNSPTTISKTGIVSIMVDTADGYIVETKIPWANFGVTPADGKQVGFDFMINDDDNDNADRDGKISWNAKQDTAWQNTSVFGTMKLNAVSPLQNLSVLDNIENTVQVYPNPAKNTIWIQGINGEFEYQINDATGKLQLSGKTNNSIQIDSLARGIYLLKINTGTEKTVKKIIKL